MLKFALVAARLKRTDKKQAYMTTTFSNKGFFKKN